MKKCEYCDEPGTKDFRGISLCPECRDDVKMEEDIQRNEDEAWAPPPFHGGWSGYDSPEENQRRTEMEEPPFPQSSSRLKLFGSGMTISELDAYNSMADYWDSASPEDRKQIVKEKLKNEGGKLVKRGGRQVMEYKAGRGFTIQEPIRFDVTWGQLGVNARDRLTKEGPSPGFVIGGHGR